MAFSRSKTVGIGVPDRESYSLALWSTHKSYPLRTGEVGCLSAIPVACGARPKGVIGLTGPLGYPTRLKLCRSLVILANWGVLPRRNGRVVLICPCLALISILRLVIALGGTLVPLRLIGRLVGVLRRSGLLNHGRPKRAGSSQGTSTGEHIANQAQEIVIHIPQLSGVVENTPLRGLQLRKRILGTGKTKLCLQYVYPF